MVGNSKGKGSELFPPVKEAILDTTKDFPPLPGKAAGAQPPSPSPTQAVQPTQESLLQQILEIQKQQAEDHRVLREQLHRQVQINAELEAKITTKAGSKDSDSATKTAEQLLEKRKKLDHVPEASVNPFPARPATLTTRMPQLYDLHGNKTYDALNKKSNSSMRYECLVLGPALSYLHDVVAECNETLDESEDGNLSYDELHKRLHAVSNSVHGVYAMLCNRWTMLELRAQLEQEPGSSQRGGNEALRAKLQFVENKVYQAADGVVADEVLQQWLNDFDKSRGKALLNSAAKNAANADARFGRDQRDQRWKDRKKHDEEKDKKPSGKTVSYLNPEEHRNSSTCTTPSQVTVGTKIEVFWEDDDCFYPGVVKKFNEDGKGYVLYDDGDEETLDLSKENFKIIGSTPVSEPTDKAADTTEENIDCGGNYEINKRGGAVENFLTLSLCERWRKELGQSRLTELAVKMQRKSLLDTTMSNYGPKARRFIHFCVQQRRPWLPATEATVVLYVAAVLEDGGVRVASMQPYLSAVNNYHEDLGFPGPAKGRAVTRAVKGMAAIQAEAAVEDENIETQRTMEPDFEDPA
ncbi:hypothetical protein CYMTET_32687 [Cymbomonas tetramitiformis]|uniref:Tudor domain-containing protein n=1 Tax=Cymbomonas tetramitiformis TaxID=36881 RepID=A0AAE0FFA2_9CHLO|nr:hypothetical protein CYMTET_32687 [Cymbomonas tetramitiformis]